MPPEAIAIPYSPKVLTNWRNNASPGLTALALDELAERMKLLEGGSAGFSDNEIPRYDLTGLGFQSSGIFVDDGQNGSGFANLNCTNLQTTGLSAPSGDIDVNNPLDLLGTEEIKGCTQIGNAGSPIAFADDLNVKGNEITDIGTDETTRRAFATVLTIDRDRTTTTVTNTAAYTTVYTFTIPADVLDGGTDNHCVHVFVSGDYVNDSGAGKRFRCQVLTGTAAPGTKYTSHNGIVINFGTDVLRWGIDLWYFGDGATNAQRCEGKFTMARNPQSVTGYGGNDDNQIVHDIGFTDALDSTSDITFTVQVSHNAAHASTTAKKYLAFAELI